ncbi:hypothetical protein FDECE_356 [Fusarium decemcellulare]|nr:hypothetical protein FDECE_356 [Fusarium decemcellulare]
MPQSLGVCSTVLRALDGYVLRVPGPQFRHAKQRLARRADRPPPYWYCNLPSPHSRPRLPSTLATRNPLRHRHNIALGELCIVFAVAGSTFGPSPPLPGGRASPQSILEPAPKPVLWPRADDFSYPLSTSSRSKISLQRAHPFETTPIFESLVHTTCSSTGGGVTTNLSEARAAHVPLPEPAILSHP